MTNRLVRVALAWLMLTAATPALAQTTPADRDWTRRLTINGFIGAASTDSDTRLAGGAGVGWGIARRVVIEGSAMWIDLPPGARVFAPSVTALVALTDRRPVAPFLRAGVGMVAASYDASRIDPPEFYRRRFHADPPGGRQSFRDPSLVFGGGVHLMAARHWTVRPEAEVTIALDGGHAHTVVAGVIRVAYLFERRQITPAGRR
jgi:hypothetical protein